MKTVKLLTDGLLIDETHYAEGDVVSVTDERAQSLLASGHAEKSDGKPSNSRNPLADSITPLPPGGVVVNPVDANSPNVSQNPGLKALAENSAKAEPKPATVKDAKPAGKPVEIAADVTANQVEVAKESAKPAEAPKPAPKPAEAPKPIPVVAPVAEAPKAE